MSADLPTPTIIPLRLLQAVALTFLAAKLILLVFVHPFMDETYYFMWGQHPALSYLDHPSLIGWTQGLSAALFGWNQLALRFPLLLTLAGDTWFLYLFARRLGGEQWRTWFWLSFALFLSMPVFFALTAVALPDHLMILACLAALYFFHGFLAGYEAGTPSWRLLYFGAVALGLALLSKYYAALFAAGLVLLTAFDPRYRGLWRTPHFYLAAVLTIALQAPVLVWNIENHFASFAFILGGRYGLGGGGMRFMGLVGYLLGIVAMVSPFALWPMLRFATSRQADAARLARVVFWVSTLAFLAASFVTNILVHWNLIAYLVVLPFLVPYLRSRLLLWGHFAFGGVTVLLFALNYVFVPISAIVGFADQTSAWGYGWDEVAARIRQIETTQKVDFVAGTDYALASPLAYALGDKNVTSLSPRSEAYDFWDNPLVKPGSSALIVGDRWRGMTEAIRARFTDVRRLDTVNVVRFGKTTNNVVIYLGTGLLPDSQETSAD